MVNRTGPLDCRIPPPLVALACGALGWFAVRAGMSLPVDFPGRMVLAAALVVLGLGTAAAAVLAFYRRRTTVDPHDPGKTSALVTGGIMRLTRNPMYLGMAVLLAGFAFYRGDAVMLAAPILFAAYITRFQIAPEERALHAAFGADYAAYCRKVRRWL